MQKITISVERMNGNIGQMTRDMNMMTRNAAPVMQVCAMSCHGRLNRLKHD